MKRKDRIFSIAIIIMALLTQTVYADSSWIWLTDNRPFDILPPVAIATIIIIEEYIKGTIDFSLFEPEKALFDTASGTQIAIHKLGARRNFSIN